MSAEDKRFAIVGDEDGADRFGHIQDLSALSDAPQDQWAWVGIDTAPPGRQPQRHPNAGTQLLEGEHAIIVTCRVEDRAALLHFLEGTLNFWAREHARQEASA